MNNRKLIFFLDRIVLILYVLFAIIDILLVSKLGKNLETNSIKAAAENALLILGLIKVYLYFDLDRRKSICAIVFILLAIILKNSVNLDYWHIVVAVFAAFNIDFDSIVMSYIAALSSTLFIIFSCIITGVIDDGYEESSVRVIGKIYDLGMGHHSWFMIFWLFLLMCIIYVMKKYKYRFWVVLLLEILTAIMWFHTGSNTATISSLLVCVIYQLNLIISFKKNRRVRIIYELIGNLSVWMPIISVIITISGVVFFGLYGYANLPFSMMNRFRNILYSLELYGVDLPFETGLEHFDNMHFNFLLGVQGESVKTGYEIDNLYGRLFIFGGFIFLGVYLLLQTHVRLKAKNEENYCFLVILMAIVVFDISEARAFTNGACIVFSLLLFARTEGNRKLKKDNNVPKLD